MNGRTNVELMREYLEAVSSMESVERVIVFYSPDVVFREYPNRVVPNGSVSHLEEMRKAFEKGRKLLSSQKYEVQSILEHGEEIAAEIVWTGRLAVAFDNLPAGSDLTAYVAMFLTFRDGKIVSQRNYDCYPPFSPDGA
jgi:ketosteroid isomerase-like protein